MRIAVGSDDVYHVAKVVASYLKSKGYIVQELGALKSGKLEPWPDVAVEVAKKVVERSVDFGVVICYTGQLVVPDHTEYRVHMLGLKR